GVINAARLPLMADARTPGRERPAQVRQRDGRTVLLDQPVNVVAATALATATGQPHDRGWIFGEAKRTARHMLIVAHAPLRRQLAGMRRRPIDKIEPAISA